MKCTSCLQEVMDGCVRWTGPSIAYFGIVNGDYYDEAMFSFATKVLEFIEANKVDLDCLGEGRVTVPVGLQIAIEKLCNLRDKDVYTTNNLFCLGANTSSFSASIVNREFNYTVSPANNGTTITYDLSDVKASLPAGYNLASSGVKAYGVYNGGTSLIANTNNASGGFNVANNRFPVSMQVSMRVITPGGEVELHKRISLQASGTGSYNAAFDVNDYSTNYDLGMPQDEFNELVSAEVCTLKVKVDNLRLVQVQDCDNITYPSSEVDEILQIHSGKLCEALSRLDDIGAEKVSYTACDEACGETTLIQSLQETIDAMNKLICQNVQDISILKSQVQELTQRVISCCA